MSDLISRQDAINVLEERLRASGYSNVALVSELNRSIGYLMKLPSAEAVQGWIPVSEMLPDKEERVLVTVWGDVDVAWRNRYGGWESAEDMYGKGNVIAWMPLPKPYKGGDDE